MNRRSLIALCSALATLVGCESGLTRDQQEFLWNGEDAYARKQYATAITTLTEFLSMAPDRPEAAKAYYVRGLSYAQIAKRTEAFNDLRRVLEVPKADPDLMWRSYVTLGTLLYEDGEWDTAYNTLNAAARRMPNMEPRDVVLFRMGVSLERLGRWAEAKAAFEELTRTFPNSNQAVAARRRIDLDATHFAVQVGVFQEQRNAEIHAANLRKQNLSPYLRRELRDNRPVFVVLLGKYGSYAEATRALGETRGKVRDAVIWP
ncbi:MAG: tetratricopeptide repeat protein [Phycisphaerae bacterium]